MKLIKPQDISLSILTRVVSANHNHALIDAGSKVLSSDSGAHGSGGEGYGIAYMMENYMKGDGFPITGLSEEHGWVRNINKQLKPGDILRVIPNHSCPVANLANELDIIYDDGTATKWKVAARGAVH